MEGYQDIRAKLYDARLAARSIKDVAFYVAEAQKVGGAVLELACGTGRILIPLAEAGLDVVGVEVSPDMLDLAREKVAKLNGEVQKHIALFEGDMRAFSLDQIFHTILIPFRSFQHVLTSEDQRQTLLCVKKHLADEGRLIMHIGDPHPQSLVGAGSSLRKMHEFTHPETGNQVLFWWSRVTHLESQISSSHYIFEEIDGFGQTVSRHHVMEETRHTFRYEMQYLLEVCGFEVEALYGDFQRGPYRCGREQIWVVKKKI